MPTETIAIAADHAGFELKQTLGKDLAEMGYQVLDLGTNGPASVDYPDFADALARAIEQGQARLGVLICGSGIGIAMAANRHRAVRAAPCHDSTSARLARAHNNANVLALGARLIGVETARDCLRSFLSADFEGGRHERRVAKMS
jgi:ribose 5-phosphate isomerase B